MRMNSGGFSKARLNRIHNTLAGYVERGETPGLVALVSRHGETHIEVIGKQAIDGEPMRRDTIFRVSSMTKPITALATMILIEECKLRLDDPVDALLPELANRRVLTRMDAPLDETVPAQRSLTVRDLLTFRMGFGQIIASPDTHPILRAATDLDIGMGPPMPRQMPAPDEWIRRLGTLPLMEQPGHRWLYNTGADVLGVLIARAAGQPFGDFLRERIFAPLGMRDSGFSVPEGKLNRLATAYGTDPKSGAAAIYDPAAGGQWSSEPAFPSGAAGLVSTVGDFLALSRMMLNKGALDGERILSRPAIEVMTTDQLTPEQKAISGLTPGDFDSIGWGFGVAIITKRDQVAFTPGTFGWDGGLGTSWRVDPTEDLIMILMTQQMWSSPQGGALFRDFWTLTYQAIDD